MPNLSKFHILKRTHLSRNDLTEPPPEEIMKHMPRYAYRLRIKPDCIEEYEREHKRVWPELLAKLKEVGFSDYSIFRRGQDLMLVFRLDDFDKAMDEMGRDPVNQRWQVSMGRLFEPVPDVQPGERFSMWKEVFYLE